MAIVFDYAVKYNGKYYKKGAPIEEPAQKAVETAESVEIEEPDKEVEAEAEPAQKAEKTRKKASGKKA